MAEIKPVAPYLEPLCRSVTVRRTPAEAFEIFTARLADWWPYAKFSIHQENTETCAMEPRVGGQIYEVSKAGERALWGTVLAWEPPGRMVMSWHPGHAPDTAQEVELRFIPVEGGTRVELEHRGWTALGAEAEEARKNYEGGWAFVFEVRYLEACS